MNSKKNIQTLLLLFSAMTAFTFSSCKKDKDETPTPVANGTIAFHLHTDVDTTEVEDYGTVYTFGGRQIIVNMAQLYISSIQLIKLDGSTVNVAGSIVLKKQQVEEYTLGSVPAGNYKSVKFNVGLSSGTNSSTPAANDSTLNQPAMWFGATAQPTGFVFVNFQGSIDTTAAASGTLLYPFSYKIGTNANLKSVTMPNQNYTVQANQIEFIHMNIDYSKLFNGIPLNVNSNLTMNTTADNGGWLGTQVSNNISSMFSYEE